MSVQVRPEWREVLGFPDVSVSESGQIMNNWNGRVLTPRFNKQGVLMIGIMRGGKQHTRAVSLLVASAFLEPPRNVSYNSVINLNGDRADCRVMNLMWRPRWFTPRYNKMFEELPYRVSAYIPKIDQHFRSLRELCTTYGLIEQDAYQDIVNQTPCFHYGWLLERSDHYKY